LEGSIDPWAACCASTVAVAFDAACWVLSASIVDCTTLASACAVAMSESLDEFAAASASAVA
jgi:hypothetical protein